MEALESKYPQALTIIGVHSAKFPNEREAAALRHAIRRHEITHSVVNDGEFAIWPGYGVRAWSTLVLIDPAGYVVTTLAGEGNAAALDAVIGELIAEHRAAGTLHEGQRPATPSDGPGDALLAFPSNSRNGRDLGVRGPVLVGSPIRRAEGKTPAIRTQHSVSVRGPSTMGNERDLSFKVTELPWEFGPISRLNSMHPLPRPSVVHYIVARVTRPHELSRRP